MYALIIDGSIWQQSKTLPHASERLDTGDLVIGFRDADQATREACGWFQIVDPGEPVYDPASEKRSRDVQIVNGTPTVAYTVEPLTADELAQRAEAEADEQEREQARRAYDLLGQYLAADPPSNAQTIAAVQLLARVTRRLIRDQYGA